jgi:pimeloyl-ACP methyl ester carboxylesterase
VKVVLLHSALGDSRLWRRQVEALAGRFEVVAPDLPGFGESPLPRGPFSYVETVAGHLPATLVGNSFGGAVALRTALAHQERVAKLVLVDPGFPDWQWSQQMRDHWTAAEEPYRAGDLGRAAQVDLDFWLKPEFHDVVRPQRLRSFELQPADVEPEVRWPETAPLSTLAVPTLVVVGDEDKPDFRAIAEHLADEIPRAELAVVPGAGHLVGVEQPDALNRLLLEFLQQ